MSGGGGGGLSWGDIVRGEIVVIPCVPYEPNGILPSVLLPILFPLLITALNSPKFISNYLYLYYLLYAHDIFCIVFLRFGVVNNHTYMYICVFSYFFF